MHKENANANNRDANVQMNIEKLLITCNKKKKTIRTLKPKPDRFVIIPT